jgi:hypothetical protein
VKTLTDFGGSLIVSKHPFLFARTIEHDAWHIHGAFQGWRYFQGASGAWYWGAYFFLGNGSDYWYPGYSGVNASDVWMELDDDANTPMPPDYRYHLGESYNYIIRPKTFDKVLTSNTEAWKAAH